MDNIYAHIQAHEHACRVCITHHISFVERQQTNTQCHKQGRMNYDFLCISDMSNEIKSKTVSLFTHFFFVFVMLTGKFRQSLLTNRCSYYYTTHAS